MLKQLAGGGAVAAVDLEHSQTLQQSHVIRLLLQRRLGDLHRLRLLPRPHEHLPGHQRHLRAVRLPHLLELAHRLLRPVF